MRNSAKPCCKTIIEACWPAHIECIEELLLKGENIYEAVDECGLSPIHIAAEIYERDLAEFLIKHGAKANTASPRGYPINIAAENGDIPCIELLIKYGAQVNPLDGEIPPLYNAIAKGNRACVRYLLACGADIHAIVPCKLFKAVRKIPLVMHTVHNIGCMEEVFLTGRVRQDDVDFRIKIVEESRTKEICYSIVAFCIPGDNLDTFSFAVSRFKDHLTKHDLIGYCCKNEAVKCFTHLITNSAELEFDYTQGLYGNVIMSSEYNSFLEILLKYDSEHGRKIDTKKLLRALLKTKNTVGLEHAVYYGYDDYTSWFLLWSCWGCQDDNECFQILRRHLNQKEASRREEEFKAY